MIDQVLSESTLYIVPTACALRPERFNFLVPLRQRSRPFPSDSWSLLLLRLLGYRFGYSQYLEGNLVSWRERTHEHSFRIRRLDRVEDPRSIPQSRVSNLVRRPREQVMSFSTPI